MKCETPALSSRSSREPVPIQKPSATERTLATRSEITRSPESSSDNVYFCTWRSYRGEVDSPPAAVDRERTMARYRFVTTWCFDAPLEAVWAEIVASEQWPTWWPGVLRNECIRRGGPDGVGALYSCEWRGPLPTRSASGRRHCGWSGRTSSNWLRAASLPGAERGASTRETARAPCTTGM